jgi:hypothetical protein
MMVSPPPLEGTHSLRSPITVGAQDAAGQLVVMVMSGPQI